MLESIEPYDSTEGKSRPVKKATTQGIAMKTGDFAKKSEKMYILQKLFSSLFVYLEFAGFQLPWQVLLFSLVPRFLAWYKRC